MESNYCVQCGEPLRVKNYCRQCDLTHQDNKGRISVFTGQAAPESQVPASPSDGGVHPAQPSGY